MPVQLRFSGYAHQDHGSARGRISYVSEVNRADARQKLFRAMVEVTDVPSSIDRLPAGMVASVDVLLRSQPIWRWLWQPLQEALGRL